MSYLDSYRGKTVLVTGHTGFKGSWLCRILLNLGANVVGFSLAPKPNDLLFDLSGVEEHMQSVIADIRDFDRLKAVFEETAPDIVFHLAAQPLVIDGYDEPRYTYDVNVMGTVNVLEAARATSSVKSILVITTDKVYLNNEWEWGYRENDVLNGFDPYSNSKSCAELATQSFTKCFFDPRSIPVSTARAGNVIGGGDFADNRIIPDCIRAALAHKDIVVRNPYSTRPYQHVLEPLFVYLKIAADQIDTFELHGAYNIGPDDCDCLTTGELVSLFCEKWDGASWHAETVEGPHEAGFLKLDCSKVKKVFGWSPTWHIDEAIARTCEWTQAWQSGVSVASIMDAQIADFREACR